MSRYLIARTLHTLLVLLGVSAAAFLLVYLSGDPAAAMVSPDATQADVDRMRALMGLDRPLAEQYLRFLGRVLHGDFGNSYRFRTATWGLVSGRLPATLHLTVVSLAVALALAIPLGMTAALRRGKTLDVLARTVATAGQSAPVFWTGIMAILLVAVRWRLLPPSGYEGWESLVLPAGTLGFYSASELVRFVRNHTLDVLGEDYVRTAHAKGLANRAVLARHVLRNTLIPVVTILGLRFGVLMGGAVVTETVFGWPGVGSLVVEAVSARDVPVVQASLMVTAAFVAVSNLLVDVAYTLIDPRITYR
ncbi:MAG: ABC transporter permease [Armatimonadetes bacterium]|nr:ABC transporter permease [Armatimonadota bacterium]